jgi:hypothetical protein
MYASFHSGRPLLRFAARCEFYRVAMRCTLNLSPRGHFVLFFALQYGQVAMRCTSLASPVEPTTRIPR